MGRVRIDGEHGGKAPADYDLRRRSGARRGAVCHAPFTGLAVGATGHFAPCRHTALRLPEGTADAAWNGPAMAELRARFRDYRVRAADCGPCVECWTSGRLLESPALAEFDRYDLPAPGVSPTPRVLVLDAAAPLEPASEKALRGWLPGLDRVEVEIDRGLDGFARDLVGRAARCEDPPEVVLRLGGDAGRPAELRGRLAELAPHRAAGAVVEVVVRLDRDNWFDLHGALELCAELGVRLVPEALPPGRERSLADADGNLLSTLHTILYRWGEALARDPDRGGPNLAFERLLGDLRRWQGTSVERGASATLSFPGGDHELAGNEAELRRILEACLRVWAHPAVETFLRALAGRPGFVAEARERTALRAAALWLGSTFGDDGILATLREVFGDRAGAARCLAADRDALAGTDLAAALEGWAADLALEAAPRQGSWELPPPRPATTHRKAAVTVVIPAYRHERYVERAIASVLAQTETRLQVLVVDDDSDDQTAELAEAVADRRVRVLRNAANLGLGRSLGGVLDRIETPYFAVLNSDDLYDPDRLRRCLEVAEEQDADLVATALVPVDDRGRRCSLSDASPVFDGRKMFDWLRWYDAHGRFDAVPDPLFDALLERCFLLTSSNLFGRTEFFARTRARWTDLEFCVDWQLFLDAARAGRLAVLPEPLLAYRLHASNTVWFDEDREWRYWVELNQVVARVLDDAVAAAGRGEDAVRPVLAALAGPLAANDHADGTGIFLGGLMNRLHLAPRDLAGSEDAERMRLLGRMRRLGRQADAVFEELGRDPAVLYRLRAEYVPLEAARNRLEVLAAECSRLETAVAGLLHDRDNLDALWRRAEAERDRTEAEKAALHDEVAGERRQKAAELAGLYARVGELEGDVGRLDFEKSEVARRAAERQRALEEEHRQQLEARRRELDDVEQQRDDLEQQRDDLEQQRDDLEQRRVRLASQLDERTAERDALRRSPEYRFGDFVLNDLRLRGVLRLVERTWSRTRHGAGIGRLAVERLLPRRAAHRAMATICWNFPIYSQTFVYQELTELCNHGFALRHVYSHLDPRENLHAQFAPLWTQKRKLRLDRSNHRRDFERFAKRMPAKVGRLVDMVCAVSGLGEDELTRHDNFLEAFSYARMVRAWRPDYIHSYFFYDRSFYALVAGFLLDIPRGVSCYADHLLADYELKVVPLHLDLADVVIATSARIKEELAGLAPGADADKILVKPNAIDTERFPVIDREEPAAGAPYRLVCVSRIEPKKGLLYLAEAVRCLRDERGMEVELHLVGEADRGMQACLDYKRELDAFLEAKGLWGKVHLEGRKTQDEVRRFLAISQLFVAPFVETAAGDKDGIPTALLEAMSTGIPPVATDAGSIAEVIDPDRDGRIVPQRDAAALAAAIEELIRDPRRRAELGRAAAAKARSRFDVRVCEGRFHERVDRLLARRSGRSPSP